MPWRGRLCCLSEASLRVTEDLDTDTVLRGVGKRQTRGFCRGRWATEA